MPTRPEAAAEPETQYEYVPIKDRDAAERPREKLLKNGPATLSDGRMCSSACRGSGAKSATRSWSKTRA